LGGVELWAPHQGKGHRRLSKIQGLAPCPPATIELGPHTRQKTQAGPLNRRNWAPAAGLPQAAPGPDRTWHPPPAHGTPCRRAQQSPPLTSARTCVHPLPCPDLVPPGIISPVGAPSQRTCTHAPARRARPARMPAAMGSDGCARAHSRLNEWAMGGRPNGLWGCGGSPHLPQGASPVVLVLVQLLGEVRFQESSLIHCSATGSLKIACPRHHT
jgi:hypothetical protein